MRYKTDIVIVMTKSSKQIQSNWRGEPNEDSLNHLKKKLNRNFEHFGLSYKNHYCLTTRINFM